jgi:NAD(P)-dependent dehydrogenase (short-subunit alcohol dehydrogenase family)
MTRPLDGKVIVVTGGGRGIGRAEALACAAAGARVLVDDTGGDRYGEGCDPSVAQAVAEAIEADGGEAIASDIDVATDAGPSQLAHLALDRWGRIDGWVAAAGVIAGRSVLKMDDERLDRVLDVTVRSAFRQVRTASRAFLDRGGGVQADSTGSIVLHTGPLAFFGAARQSALSAAGAAVVGLTRSAAIELRKHRIRVNAIAPTARTRATEDLPLFRGIAADSMGPEFAGPVAVHLLCEASAQVTGEVVGVAGNRLYAFRTRETPGWFGGATPIEVADLGALWPQIVKP